MSRGIYTAFALQIAGVPYTFTTSAVSGLTSTSPLWIADGMTAADGFLVWPSSVSWEERADPLRGDLNVGSVRFELHDAKVDGSNLLTLLATRDETSVTSSPLASSLTASSTTIPVGDGTLFDTFPRVVWINREAILCDSRTSNTLNVDTRGYLGTKATAHLVDDDRALYPEVYTECPWTTRRKVMFYGVKADGTARLLYVGFATRTPSLSDNGATFDLTVEPLWNVLRGCPVGEVASSARIVGYGLSGVQVDSLVVPSLLRTAVSVSGYATVNVGTTGVWRDWAALVSRHTSQVATRTSSRASLVDLHFLRSGGSAQVSADSATTFSLRMEFLGELAPSGPSTYRTATRQSAALTLDKVPDVGHVVVNYAQSTFPVSSLRGLPSSWTVTGSPWTDAGFTTTSTPSLRVHIDKEWSALMSGVTTADTGSTGAAVTGAIDVRPRGFTTARPLAVFTLRDPMPLQFVYRVTTGHWLWGLKNAVVDLCADGVTDDLDWTDADVVSRYTAGLVTERDWVFDGQRTFGDVATECCLLFGCTPVLRSGRLAIYPWRWPDAQDTVVATFTRANTLGKPSWRRWGEGLANRLKVKADELTLDATQAGSIARYGPGQQISLDLAGAEQQRRVTGDPVEFARSILARVELWSDPLGIVTWTATLDYAETVELGSFVALEDIWLLPDGEGARNWTGEAFVIARSLDLGSGTVRFEGVVFQRESYPYAPCAKVSTLVDPDKVSLASGYVSGSTTYSGGADIDGFAAGDVVQFIVRDSTTLTTDTRTILSVDPGMGTITLTGAMSAGMQSAITGGSWVDVRFAAYGSCVASQQSEWMYVADDATRVIGGTSELARRIAP